MDDLLANPQKLLALLCIAGLVIGVNAALFSALLHRQASQQQASKWFQAVSGGREARQRQNEQLNELHQRVQKLHNESPDKEE